jgi:hypothetical protein
MISTVTEAITALRKSWEAIVQECRCVYGGEPQYQAMLYHILRLFGEVPVTQLGMNVRIKFYKPTSRMFIERSMSRKEGYEGVHEVIPDVVIYDPEVRGKWQRRMADGTVKNILLAMEMKCSERKEGRLQPGEIMKDLKKLHALREEAQARSRTISPVVFIVDTAIDPNERMKSSALNHIRAEAKPLEIGLLYLPPQPAMPFQSLW